MKSYCSLWEKIELHAVNVYQINIQRQRKEIRTSSPFQNFFATNLNSFVMLSLIIYCLMKFTYCPFLFHKRLRKIFPLKMLRYNCFMNRCTKNEKSGMCNRLWAHRSLFNFTDVIILLVTVIYYPCRYSLPPLFSLHLRKYLGTHCVMCLSISSLFPSNTHNLPFMLHFLLLIRWFISHLLFFSFFLSLPKAVDT